MSTSEEDIFVSLLQNVEKLQDLGNNYLWKKLYQGSVDGFKHDVFRKKCHNHPNVICFIHTTTNNVFGGYTSTGWSHAQNMHDTKSFLFLIRSSKQFKSEIFDKLYDGYQGGFAVITRAHCVAMFGGGYDICIGKDCNKSTKSYTSAWTYILPSPHHLNGEERAFTVLDVEAFQLIPQ